MKPLLALLCAVAIGYVAYEFVYPPMANFLALNKPLPVVVAQVAPVEAPPITLNMPKVEDPKPVEPVMEKKPEPMVVEAPPPPPPPPPPKVDPNAFVPPTFQTMDEITNNWTTLPKSTFPRQVTIAKELEVKGTVGATKIPAGGKAFAIEQQGENLLLSPAVGSPFRGLLPLGDTDLKQVMLQAYEQYKATATETARRAHEAKIAEAKAPKKKAAPKGPLSDDKPIQDKDGTYPLLLASMKEGEVTEVKPDNIKKWGSVTKETVKGQTVWVVVVSIETETPFGKFEQDVRAHVKNQAVLEWVYAGSGETVP